jgi:2-methylcitrate dehydratase PrpD
VGRKFRTNALDACVANGTAAHSEDFDDTILDCALHQGIVVVTSSVALAEAVHATGSALLEAIVTGYEVAARVGLAVNEMPGKAHHGKGFHPTGTCGVFGAAAAASKLLSLSINQTCMALGIAGSAASGLMEFLSNGSMVKRLHPGSAARSGLLAAMLARNGFTGPETVFEGRDGFLRAYSEGDRFDAEWLVSGLGETWYTLRTSFKYYACCQHCHTPIDALLALVRAEGFGPEQVEQIEIRHPPAAHYLIGEPIGRKRNPGSMLDAQMSLPYCMAVALTDGHVGVHQFDGKHRCDKRVVELMQKVSPMADQDLEKEFSATCWPALVTVTLAGGKTLSARCDHPKGSPDSPMTDEEFLQKLRQQALRALKPRAMERLVSGLQEVDECSDVATVISALGLKGGDA